MNEHQGRTGKEQRTAKRGFVCTGCDSATVDFQPAAYPITTLRSGRIQGLYAALVSGHLAGSRMQKQTFLFFTRWLLTVYVERP